MNVRRLVIVPALAVALVVPAACGVPPQEHPEVVDHADVPFGLAEETTPTPPSSTSVPVSPDRPTAD
jgi:hypothetical protein